MEVAVVARKRDNREGGEAQGGGKIVAGFQSRRLVVVGVAGDELSVDGPSVCKISKVEGRMEGVVVVHEVGIVALVHPLLGTAIEAGEAQVEAVERLDTYARGGTEQTGVLQWDGGVDVGAQFVVHYSGSSPHGDTTLVPRHRHERALAERVVDGQCRSAGVGSTHGDRL